MGEILSNITGFVIPILVVFAAIAFVVALKVAASRYKKIPPGKVGIFYGMKYKDEKGNVKGFMVMSGGGRIQRPLVEGYLEIPTTSFQVEINESGIPNKDNVKLTVPGVATCKISTKPEDLNNAIDALIDKLTQEADPKRGQMNENPIEEFVRNILKGHLRSIIGKLDIDELLRKRDEFNKRVVEESKQELSTFGIDLQNLVIQDIKDSEGYIDALGRRAVADAVADAETKVAEATRNKDIAVSHAARESALVKAENEGKIAEANKDRDLKIAGFKKVTGTANAEASMAEQIALAAQEQTLKVAEAARDAASTQARIEVSTKEGERRAAELKATVVAQATADKETAILKAEGQKQTAILDAQAQAEVLRTTAEAKKNAAVLEGEGTSRATELNLVAKAKGDAASEREVLVARAEGTKQLNDALAQMSDAAKLILILDRLPLLLEKGGDAGSKVLGAMFGPVAAGLASIDSVRIVQMGNGDGKGGGVGQMANVVPETVFNILGQLKARGIDLSKLSSMLGIDLSGLDSLLDGVGPASASGEAVRSTTVNASQS
jgi:flotillin